MRVLPLVLVHNFDYILKLHTKSSVFWRRGLANPLCGSVMSVQRCMASLRDFKTIGMIGAGSHLYKETLGRKPNGYYLQKLTEKFRLPNPKHFHFIGGTMFWVRVSVIRPVFAKVQIQELWNGMNTPGTLDRYWYLLNYKDKGLSTVEQAEYHYLTVGMKAGRFKNCLDAREKGAGGRCMADGMIEHAYERLFGLMVEVSGFTIMGL